MVQIRRGLAVLGCLAFAAMWGWGALLQSGWMVLCAATFALGDALCALALWRGWFWARWFGLGIGLVGTLQMCVWFGMNPQMIHRPEMLLQGIAFPSMLVLLAGRAMRAHYEGNGSPRNAWRFSAASVRLLAWAVVLNIATAPMLLLHACIDPAMALEVRLGVIAVGLCVVAGVVAVIRQRAVGLFLMPLGGVGTMVIGLHALPTLQAAVACGDMHQQLVDLSAVAAFPAGVIGALASALAFARPVLHFVRRSTG